MESAGPASMELRLVSPDDELGNLEADGLE